MLTQNDEKAVAGPKRLVSKIAGSLGIVEKNLNEVDFDDVSISESVAQTLQGLESHINALLGDVSTSPGISAYWVKDSKELVLCAQALDGLHLVRVPEDHWRLKPRTYH